MMIVYLLSGPVVAVIIFTALAVPGASTFAAIAGGLVAGVCAPALIACLHVAFKSKLRLKIIDKLPLKTGQ